MAGVRGYVKVAKPMDVLRAAIEAGAGRRAGASLGGIHAKLPTLSGRMLYMRLLYLRKTGRLKLAEFGSRASARYFLPRVEPDGDLVRAALVAKCSEVQKRRYKGDTPPALPPGAHEDLRGPFHDNLDRCEALWCKLLAGAVYTSIKLSPPAHNGGAAPPSEPSPAAMRPAG